MKVKCLYAGDAVGIGTGLLTEGRIYTVMRREGGYYIMVCDDGEVYSKLATRFVIVE
jgi:hypothetical protein